MPHDQLSRYRWFFLGLSLITSTFVSAIPFSCMPVLFEEIRRDLDLSLVQVGTIWGAASMAGIFVSLFAGYLGDRFGGKSVIAIASIFVALTGAARGLSNGFLALAATVLLNGLVRAVIPINITKLTAAAFNGRNLGFANAVGAMGMGLGLMLGPMVSATVVSPWLGGWRNVMYFYGGLSAAVGSLWFLMGKQPAVDDRPVPRAEARPLRETLPSVMRLPVVWLVGLTLMFRMAGIQGMTGYLPIFLRGQGWPEASADASLSVFYGVSTACVVPLAMLSDRIGIRKGFLLAAVCIMTASLALLPLVSSGGGVWVLMIISGMFMDGFMSIMMTTLLESKGVNSSNAGLALGLVFTIGPVGSVLAPPLGNSLASTSPALPFFFWAALALVSVVTISFVKDTGWRSQRRRLKAGTEPSSAPS